MHIYAYMYTCMVLEYYLLLPTREVGEMPSMVPRACLLAIAATAALPGRGAATTLPLTCDEEAELVRNLDYVRDVCQQTGESFLDSRVRVPSTCASPTCKVAVERVARDCGPFP